MKKISGADDGWCPFKAGLYETEIEGDILSIKWCKKSTLSEQIWKTDSFTLPLK